MVVSTSDSSSMKTDVIFKFKTADVDEDALTLTSSKSNLTNASRTVLTVNNGKDGYRYHFDVKNNDNGKTWSPWEGFKQDNSFEWYAGPASAKNGKTITATVQGQDGKTVVKPIELTLPVVESSLVLNQITCSNQNPLASDTVKLSAKASGGSGYYQYRFRVENNNNGKWWTIQDYKESDCCNWYAGPSGGSKTIYVDVKDTQTGDIVSKQMIIGVADPTMKVSVLTLEPSSLTASTNTVLKATATGATGDVNYRFSVYNNDTGKFWEIRKYDKSNTCTWYAGQAGGSKTVYVDVKDSTGKTTSLVLNVLVED